MRYFVECASTLLGMAIEWRGRGVDEEGIDAHTGQRVVAVDQRYYRPTEVETLLGDPTKAKEKLGWMPEISFEQLVEEMVRADQQTAERDALCRREGFHVFDHHE